MAYNYNPQSQQQGYVAFKGGYPPQGGYGFHAPPGSCAQEANVYYKDEECIIGRGGPGPMPGLTFSEKTIRMAFIRKVYAILMVQLAITGGFVALFVLNEDAKLWTRAHPGILILATIISFAISFALICFEDLRRKAPANFICLAVFTITQGFALGTFSSSFKAKGVLLAVGITAVVCLALTAFSFQTKVDFTAMGGVMLVGCVVLMLFGILTFFLRSYFPVLQIILGCLGALFFSIFLIYDTQSMIGGNHKCTISPEEYIFAALTLYLDVVNIFIYILSILGERD